MGLNISLDQWRSLVAVVDAGGYAAAAEALGKSQSAISYGVQKLESRLGVRAFELEGRRAVLTESGRLLYRRAKQLLEDAAALEQAAGTLGQRYEAEIRVAVEAVFPTWLLLECVASMSEQFPLTRIDVFETVLTGTAEALTSKAVELAVIGRPPAGFLGDHLMRVRFIPVAHPDHPLHHLGGAIGYDALRKFRQLVVRDSGERRVDAGWLGAEQRWTLTNFPTSIHAACRGMGFAWYPEEKIRRELAAGELKRLPLVEGAERFTDLYLVYANRDYAGPAARALGAVLTDRVRQLAPMDLSIT